MAGPAARTWPREPTGRPAGRARRGRGHARGWRGPAGAGGRSSSPGTRCRAGCPPRCRPRDVFTAGADRRGRGVLALGAGAGAGARSPSRWPSRAGWASHGRVRRIVERLPGRWWAQVVLGVAVLAADRSGRHPAARVARRYRHLRDYGLSTQSTGEWLVDVARASWSAIVTTSLVLLVLVGCARRWRRGLAGRRRRASWVWSCWSPRSSTRCWSSRSSTTSPRCRTGRCAARSSSSPTRRASRSTTCWSRTRRGVRRRSTPTSRASASTRRVVVYDNLVEDLPEDRGAVGGRPRAGPRQAPRRGDRVRARRGRARCSAWACCRSSSGPWGSGAGCPWPTRPSCRWCWPWPRVATLVASPVQNTVSRQIETRADVDALADDRGLRTRSSAMQRAARAAVVQRPDAARLVAVLVRQPPDLAAADRDRAAAGRGPTGLTEMRKAAGLVTGGLVDPRVSEGYSVAGIARRRGRVAHRVAGVGEQVRTLSPKANTTTTIRAAIPVISSPYSTADAPRRSS